MSVLRGHVIKPGMRYYLLIMQATGRAGRSAVGATDAIGMMEEQLPNMELMLTERGAAQRRMAPRW